MTSEAASGPRLPRSDGQGTGAGGTPTVTDANGCWLWTGAVSPNGYGRYGIAYAHRLAYEQAYGPIPPGLQIDHLCRVRRCVNPDHLEAVTQRENILRGTSEVARKARATACKHGHEWTPENTYIRPNDGCRQCRRCTRDRYMARRSA